MDLILRLPGFLVALYISLLLSIMYIGYRIIVFEVIIGTLYALVGKNNSETKSFQWRKALKPFRISYSYLINGYDIAKQEIWL